MIRPAKSEAPPGANGMIMCTGFCGYVDAVCACAGLIPPVDSSAVTNHVVINHAARDRGGVIDVHLSCGTENRGHTDFRSCVGVLCPSASLANETSQQAS